jgi:hypothetical protein
MRPESQPHHEPPEAPLDSGTMIVAPEPSPIAIANDGLPTTVTR